MSTELNPQAQQAWNIIETTNTNLFLTGKAGTGKTTFLRRLKAESSKRIIVVAPTGIAAINAEGMTIHSFFQLSFAPFLPNYSMKEQQYRFSKQKIRVIQSVDTLVIDEISMVRADLLDAVDSVLRRFRKNQQPFGGVQIVMIGDLGQLAPVAKDDEWQMLSRYYDTPYFFSSLALKRTPYAIIELTKVYRQRDNYFLDLLNKVRDNRADETVLKALNSRYVPGFQPRSDEGYIRLVTHNSQAQQENERQLRMLPTQAFTYRASIEGKYPEMLFPTDETLVLKKGAQVMFVKNDSSAEKAYYNGMIGTIEAISADGLSVRAKDTGEIINVEREKWDNTRYVLNEQTSEISEEVDGTFSQYPLKTAWAITVHKSQGLTFDRAIIDVQHAFTHGQTYVALSRCRMLEGLVLSAPLPMTAIIRDSAVDDFASHAVEHTPSDDQISMLQRNYFLSVLSELFDFRPLMNAFDRVLDLLTGHFKRTYPKLIMEFKVRSESIKTQLYDVAERFKLQYSQIVISSADYRNDAHLQERLVKGAEYFSRTISDVEQLVRKTTVKTDNKELKKRWADLFPSLKEIVMQKRALLNVVSADGFSLNEFLHQRALVLAGKVGDTEAKPKTAAKPTSGNKAPAAPKPAADEILHPDVLEALTDWRRERALKAHVPAYCIAQQKSLQQIANQLPQTQEALAAITSFGKVRAEKYGEEILAVIYKMLQEDD